MKKRIFTSVLVCMLFTLFAIPSSYASEKNIDIYLNGKLLDIPTSYGAPFYDSNNRLQIPIRYIIESCGYEIMWDNPTQTATIPTNDGNVVITLGSNILYTPKGNIKMDTVATARAERTYIPLRFALEALDFNVEWSGGKNSDTVRITGEIGGNAPGNTQTVDAPVNIRITKQDENAVYIQWDAVSGADYYHFYYQEQGDYTYWYDDDPVYSPEPLRIYHQQGYSAVYYNLIPGRSYNVFVTSVKNGVESTESEVLSFTFTGTIKNQVISYYSDAYWLPDFGAIYDLAPTFHSTNITGGGYSYNLGGRSNLIESYCTLLEKNGFTYDEYLTNYMNNQDVSQLCIVYLSRQGYPVMISASKYQNELSIVYVTDI